MIMFPNFADVPKVPVTMSTQQSEGRQVLGFWFTLSPVFHNDP